MIQSTFEETSEDYKAFVDKFKRKKTTDRRGRSETRGGGTRGGESMGALTS